MGLSYSVDYEVPREGVFDFLSAANELCDGQATSLLHWPDGRQMLFRGEDFSYKGPQPQNWAVDCSFDQASLCTALLFETDDVLAKSKDNYAQVSDGRLAVGCLYLRLQMEPWTWVEAETDQVTIRFVCAATRMSRDMAASLSARHTFTNLARSGGALSCFFNSEGNDDRVWFADDEAMNVAAPGYKFLSLSEARAKIKICLHSRGPLSGHDLIARFNWMRHDDDSGVRGAACWSLVDERSPEVDVLLHDRLKHDPDWRVRFVAARTLGERPGQANDEALFSALRDSDWNVVIGAAKALGSPTHHAQPARGLADELAAIVANLPTRGPAMGAFLTVMDELSLTYQHDGKKHHAEVIRRRMNEPNFPFVEEAQKAIERLEVWSERKK